MRSLQIILFIILTAPAFSQNNFQHGEKLEYLIHYGPINAGKGIAELVEADYNGQTVFHAKAIGQTIGLANRLYKIRDVYEAYFDTISFLPVKSIRDINEGRYKRHDEVTYDHKNLKAYSLKSGEHDIPANIMDMTSVFFYIRNVDFDTMEIGQIININTFFDDELFPFDIRYFGKDRIRIQDTEYNSIKLVPYVEPGRIFESEDDMIIWLSDDDNQIPLRVRFDLIIGSFKCDLVKYSGLKY